LLPRVQGDVDPTLCRIGPSGIFSPLENSTPHSLPRRQTMWQQMLDLNPSNEVKVLREDVKSVRTQSSVGFAGGRS
jgi:hypothetical protein